MKRTAQRCCNLTALTNRLNNVAELGKWGREGGPSKGILRKGRDEMKKILILHESRKILVAGRNRCNNFKCNQFLIGSKETGTAVLIDASDDWMDDWAIFLNGSGLKLTNVFLTHCHIDNIINLNPLLQIVPDADKVSIAWSMGDLEWVNNFPRACERYHRFEMKGAQLPMSIQRPQDQLLNAASNRSTTFLQLGTTLLFYLSTPGHSMGHMILHVPQEKLLFTGDLIFDSSIGRVDLPWGNAAHLAQSLRMLEDIPDNTVLLPGHGRLTTMGRERRFNRGLQRVYEMMEGGKQVPLIGYNDGYL